MSRRPHQCGQVVAIAGVGVDALIQQLLNHRLIAAPGRINDRGLASGVDGFGIGALTQKYGDHGCVAGVGGCSNRGDAAAASDVGIGTSFEQNPGGGGAFLLDGHKQSR